MDAQKVALKSLADTTYDSVNGYRQAAENANTPRLKQTLAQCAEKRSQTLSSLNAELARHGCDQADGTVAGSAHQIWADITGLFENGDENAVERVEEGEDYIAKKFEEVLEQCDFDAQTQQVVQAAYQEIQAGERFTDQLEAYVD
ncbi:PA2169 family four-helix-bundle protein [Pontixanthobacter aestiaquae]|uniref:PA2169 family four-helix-bundle protein n=1 Tax=Pontixanthobacter aestiaquae TaxID=1509367 RepID=A0A844Z677_9SPHN|nr:PA2169 family four-helix-bundle protein [Pontixanthobacter aestiaquae]MDN3645684.1 PA2169 family four-helix-bundle protein [Pontixanthobacter aestiaquae]MXO83318.1 PA2169 family four-helix-bundle protein [Pontixanthobacter aestiaquae]